VGKYPASEFEKALDGDRKMVITLLGKVAPELGSSFRATPIDWWILPCGVKFLMASPGRKGGFEW
jgi:hypothetical protein